MSDKAIWYLENIDVGGIFCPKKLGDRINDQHLKLVKKDEYVYLPDEDSDKIYFINDGRIKIGSFADNGKEITKAILNEGEVFGELALLTDDVRTADVVAKSDLRIMSMAKTEFIDHLMKNPEHAMQMLKSIGNRMKKMLGKSGE